VNIVADALYFGDRLQKTNWCLVAFRDPKQKENLWWKFGEAETTSLYLEGRIYLENLGYEIMSVTGDGFSGLRTAFDGIPFQMCHVHMERIITDGTTRKPELEAGQVLLALAKLLHHADEKTFRNYVEKYLDRYRDLLNEKTTSPVSGETFFTHKPLRQSALSLMRFLPYLFTFKKHKDISRTTNSLEGHFSHIRDIVEIHRGLSKQNKQKILHSILLASSIAPTEGKLKHIL
jgi:hypothetical protein